MKLLITGGAGFIGSHLVDYFLGKGFSVIVIDNLSWGRKEFLEHNLTNPKFTFINLDLLEINKLKKNIPKDIDTVFHLAANSDIMRSTLEPNLDFENTIVATFNLLQFMREYKVNKIYFISGSGVYGDVGRSYITEDFGPMLPISMYGASKLSAEAMISTFVNLYNLQAWILRPANIIGPRATHGVIFDFINQLKKHPNYLKVLGNGKQSKSYLYIDDVIQAIDLAWKKAKDKINVFNIASDSYMTVSEIANIIFKEMDLRKVKIQYTGGKRGWRGDVPIVRLTNDKLEDLGWKCNHNSREAVIKTIKALLQQNI